MGCRTHPVLTLILLWSCLTLTTLVHAQEFTERKTPDRLDIGLKSGEILTDVHYKVDPRLRVVKVEVAGQKRNISYLDVAFMKSGDEDLTETILGPGYGSGVPATAESLSAAPAATDTTAVLQPTGSEAWFSTDSPEYRQATTAIWSVAVRGAANFSTPMGDYYEGSRGGIGYEGDLWFAVNHYVGIQLSVSRSGMQWDDDWLRRFDLDPSDFEMTVMRYRVSGMVYKHLDAARRDRSMIYGCVGLGAINHDLTAQVEDAAGDVIGELSSSETKFVVNYGGGILKTVGPNIGLDLSLDLDQVYASGGSEYDSDLQLAWILDLRVGLVAFF